MDRLINYLKQFGEIDNQNIKNWTDDLKVENIKKNDYFLEAGNYSNRIGFVGRGVLRTFFCDIYGNEVTRCFHSENGFIVNLDSFRNHNVSAEYIQALDDCEIVVIDRDLFTKMSKSFNNWDNIVDKISVNVLLQKVLDRSELVTQDATTKYIKFIEKFPHIAYRIPLGHLASYLGIKQQSLSRIRKEISLQDSFSTNLKAI